MQSNGFGRRRLQVQILSAATPMIAKVTTIVNKTSNFMLLHGHSDTLAVASHNLNFGHNGCDHEKKLSVLYGDSASCY